MITPGYAITATERVLPRLALNFTTASLDPRVTITRALNTATRVNNSGLIETVNANLPRFDYDPVTLLPRGLLIEETRANLIGSSNAFTNATYWVVNGSPTVLDNQVVSPDGATNAATFEVSGASNGFGVYSASSIAAGTYTCSLFFKRISGNIVVRLGFSTNSSTINISTLAIVNGTNSVGSVVPWGNGYYRFTVVVTTASALALNIYSIGSNTGKMAIYGCQVEAGSFATSYIPTTAGTLTRNADAVVMTGTNFSSWYNNSEGTFVVSFQIPYATGITRRAISVNDGTANNSIQVAVVNTNNQAYYEVRDSNVVQVSALSGSGFTVGIPIRSAFAYKINDFAYAAFGVAAGTDTSGTVPAVTQMEIGAHVGVAMNGWVSAINYYPSRLTNSEVSAFSKL